MHFIRGWPWQPSWSRVVFGVSMSRGSSNKVVEQRSSSSNTTAPIDTPSGSLLTYTNTHTHTHTHCYTYEDINLTLLSKAFKYPISTFKQHFSRVEQAKCPHISIVSSFCWLKKYNYTHTHTDALISASVGHSGDGHQSIIVYMFFLTPVSSPTAAS